MNSQVMTARARQNAHARNRWRTTAAQHLAAKRERLKREGRERRQTAEERRVIPNAPVITAPRRRSDATEECAHELAHGCVWCHEEDANRTPPQHSTRK